MSSSNRTSIAGHSGVDDSVIFDTKRMLELVQANRGRLFARLRRMRLPHEDAEDVFQETCIRLLTTPPHWQGEQSCCGYIFKIAANLGKDALRRRRRRRYGHFTSLEDQILECDKPKPAEYVEQKQLSDALWKAVDQLTPRCQTAINLHYGHEWSFARIGLRLGINKKTVERDIILARRYCYAVLARGVAE